MSRTKLNTSTKYGSHLYMLAVMVIVLLTSCTIKTSIKNFIGFQTNTEQGAPSNYLSFFSNSLERCENVESASVKVVQKSSLNTLSVLPAVIPGSFLFLDRYSLKTKLRHPLYGNLKILEALPIYLKCRKLIL